MNIDFVISAPGVYSGDVSGAFDYDAVFEPIRNLVCSLKDHSAFCMALRSSAFVLRVVNADAEAMRELRRIAANISLAMHSIDKPSHLAPEYRFAVVYDYEIS